MTATPIKINRVITNGQINPLIKTYDQLKSCCQEKKDLIQAQYTHCYPLPLFGTPYKYCQTGVSSIHARYLGHPATSYLTWTLAIQHDVPSYQTQTR